MSAYDHTLAQIAYHYAIKHVEREIRHVRLLLFMPSNRRYLAVLKEHKAMLERREVKLGRKS